MPHNGGVAQIRTRTGLDARDALARAALEVIREEGFDALSLLRVAQRVGVSKSAVYHHFRTKDELVQRALAPVADGLRDIIGTPVPVEERIDRLIDLALAHKEVIALCSPATAARIGEQTLGDSNAHGVEIMQALAPPGTEAVQARIRVEVFLAALAAAVNACEHSSDIDELRPALRGLILP